MPNKLLVSVWRKENGNYIGCAFFNVKDLKQGGRNQFGGTFEIPVSEFEAEIKEWEKERDIHKTEIKFEWSERRSDVPKINRLELLFENATDSE